MILPTQWTAAALSALVLLSRPGAADSHDDVSLQNDQSLLWGPYRPNLYFGMRPRLPKSLMTALLWAKVDNYVDVQNSFRYTCEQNDGMAGYGWDQYDPRRGGTQTLHDDTNKIDIKTTLVKIPGGQYGGSWAVRVSGEPRPDAPPDLKTTMFLYVADESHSPDTIALDSDSTDGSTGFASDQTVSFTGSSIDLGKYKLAITPGKTSHPGSDHPVSSTRDPSKTTVQSLNIPDEHMWQAKVLLFQQLKKGVDQIIKDYGPENAPAPWQTYQLTHQPGAGNAHLVQKVLEGPFEFDILFSSASADHDLTSDDVTREIRNNADLFDQRFADVFRPAAPFDADSKYRRFGESLLSNLAGGIGYFYGHHVVDRSNAPEYDEENEGFWEETEAARARRREQPEGPYELFTSIPSRPFFPRGFLWDEGFHLLPIADWDMHLALDIIRAWYDLMDEDGWIAREQILGDEARSKVPPEFQVQYPHYANPPTLFLVLDSFLDKLRAGDAKGHGKGGDLGDAHLNDPSLGLDYLRKLYPLLRKQYQWFRRTQSGDLKSYDREAFSMREAYRWRGRSVQHILTSGLDDYPRAQPPHPGELHLDLMSWVGLMQRVLDKIATALDLTDDAREYAAARNALQRNLVDLHWSESDHCFCDATIDAFEEHALVCHKGYITLFPFFIGLLPADDPRLAQTLDILADEDHLWSPHGLRSLSKKSPLYGTEENYWRSPIWINMNYLAIQQLHDLALKEGPLKARAADLYTRLRRNVVDTVYESWAATGFAWEVYDPETGAGSRTQHFTGWTSLVVKIMAMEDLSGGAGSSGKDEL